MIRAGLTRLNQLQNHFIAYLREGKDEAAMRYPKMLITCEETEAAKLVEQFLTDEGFTEEEFLRVDSDKKWSVPPNEWQSLKTKLFQMDKSNAPRVVISVMMLKEGFDVNNICVIVPLRSTVSSILLEQTIGRGLRLMWREPEFEELKRENRKRLLEEKRAPLNHMDVLHIIEHPNFMGFYQDLIEEGIEIGEIEDDEGGSGTEGMITVNLREGYERFDLSWISRVEEAEEALKELNVDEDALEPFPLRFDQLQLMIGRDGERWHAEVVAKSRTIFGDYRVEDGIMTATSYNDFLGRLTQRVARLLEEDVGRHLKERTRFPGLQIQLPCLAAIIDRYIRIRLFQEQIDPLAGENWRVLIYREVPQHIVKQIGGAIAKAQERQEVIRLAEVSLRALSEVKTLRAPLSNTFPVDKCIYERAVLTKKINSKQILLIC